MWTLFHLVYQITMFNVLYTAQLVPASDYSRPTFVSLNNCLQQIAMIKEEVQRKGIFGLQICFSHDGNDYRL
mgnify:CR=1 FL=1